MPPAAEITWRSRPEPADIGRVEALVAAAGPFSAEEVRVAGELVETTLSGREPYQFVFAEAARNLAGYICFDRIPLSAVSFDLYWIAVRPKFRGMGLGRALLDRATAAIRAQGGNQLFAETSGRSDYAPARGFYLKSGFAEAARFEGFYAPGDDKLVYRLRL